MSKRRPLVRSMARWRSQPTARQMAWLCALYERCMAMERAP